MKNIMLGLAAFLLSSLASAAFSGAPALHTCTVQGSVPAGNGGTVTFTAEGYGTTVEEARADALSQIPDGRILGCD